MATTTREQHVTPNGITLSGSAADIAAFIHKAAVRAAEDDVAKTQVSTKDKNDHPDSDFAYIESGGHKDESGRTTPRSKRHFLIHDAAHVRNALARIGQGAKFGQEALPKVKAAARSFGIEVSKQAEAIAQFAGGIAQLRETGLDMQTLQQVVKDAMGPELDDGIDGLDPTVPLCEPDEMGPGDPTDPGSPAWESIDAATAQKWTSIFAYGKRAIGLLGEREMLEAASADPDDAENAYDLATVCDALDYAISILAPFAVGEQSEADCGAAELAAIGKAAAGLEGLPFGLIEGYAAVRKSGRVLSSANEGLIRQAAADLQSVLASLPKAPVTDDGQPVAKQEGTPVEGTQTATAPEAGQDTAPVAKETASAEAQARDTGPVNAGGTTGLGEPRRTGPEGSLPADGPQAALPGDVPGRTVIKAAAVGVFGHDRRFLGLTDASAIVTDIAKADGEGKKAMCVVYNQAGKLMGIVDPDDITPVANSEAEPDEAPADGDGGTDSAAAASPAAADMTPAPPAETGTPADAVDDDGTVAKSSDNENQDVFAVLKSTIAEAVAAALGERGPAEDVAKQADVAGLLGEVETLKARLATVEAQPAAPKVFTNGAVPPAHQMRGQDQGTAAVNVAKAAELRRQFREADPVEQNRLANEMQQAAIGHLNALHGRA